MRGSPEERFWSKVEKTSTCWLWKAATDGWGYGQFGYKRKVRQAHRWAYEHIAGKTIPSGFQLHHVCRTRSCVNPDHLEPISPRDHALEPGHAGAIQRAKTRCAQGHPFDRVDANGRRFCRICVAAAQRRRYYRKRAAVSEGSR